MKIPMMTMAVLLVMAAASSARSEEVPSLDEEFMRAHRMIESVHAGIRGPNLSPVVGVAGGFSEKNGADRLVSLLPFTLEIDGNGLGDATLTLLQVDDKDGRLMWRRSILRLRHETRSAAAWNGGPVTSFDLLAYRLEAKAWTRDKASGALIIFGEAAIGGAVKAGDYPDYQRLVDFQKTPGINVDRHGYQDDSAPSDAGWAPSGRAEAGAALRWGSMTLGYAVQAEGFSQIPAWLQKADGPAQGNLGRTYYKVGAPQRFDVQILRNHVDQKVFARVALSEQQALFGELRFLDGDQSLVRAGYTLTR